MTEKKLEEIVDLLAEYGGFNREYLRDKLLDGCSETKNKMIEVASNQMTFPDTWEEFEKQYGFYDSKQVYMYGNTRLIPSFRVQQWLDHLDDVKCKKQLQENKMEQVAAMFGKKLREVFSVEFVCNRNFVSCCYFKPDGLFCEDRGPCETMLNNLLTGKAVITNE